MVAVARSPAEFPPEPDHRVAAEFPPEPDHRVVAAVAGDREAAHALLLEVAPRIRNLVRYLIRNDDEVDDIAQEAMVAVLKSLADYRAEGAFHAWVDRITARATFKVLRTRKRRREEPLHPDQAEPTHDPFGEFHSRRRLVALLDRLPEAQRHVLVLHYVLGMTALEIAEELGVPAETVRSRLRLAKTTLRTRLESTHR